MDPGNPRKISKFTKETRNSLGHKKFSPLISVDSLVLKRRPIASTIKKEFVESKAWLISIEKVAKAKGPCPLNKHMVNQCISTTVEYATSFFKSIW